MTINVPRRAQAASYERKEIIIPRVSRSINATVPLTMYQCLDVKDDYETNITIQHKFCKNYNNAKSRIVMFLHISDFKNYYTNCIDLKFFFL